MPTRILCLLLASHLAAWCPLPSAAAEPTNAAASGIAPPQSGQVAGDVFTDPDNPIRKLFGGERLDLWSLKRPQRPSVPEVAIAVNAAGLKLTPIDRFLLAEQQAAGIDLKKWPPVEANRRTLIRRLSFDLTGLPPAAEDVRAFAADEAGDAYEQLVERLLASPRYGERQARLWLDVVRYADTHGYERDEFRPLIWQYRDYVIRSFNQDKPFDQFIREQLAGDELIDGPPKTAAEADALIATGYLRLCPWDSTAAIFQEEERLKQEQLADLTNTTAAAFLGLTFSCCQCHDHKYDPLSQADHYRLRAFFAAWQPRDDLAIETAEQQAEIDRHNAALDQQLAPLKQAQEKLLKESEAEKNRGEQLEQQIRELEARRRQPRVAMGATDGGDNAPATRVFSQGDITQPAEEVPPGFVSVLYPGPADVQAPRGGTTGRRLALARWIASPENPWTARVIVNRVWQQHFGIGLVATGNDFGLAGSRPTHPALLDWLAVEFVENGWSIKELHRRIVLSAAYRQPSHPHGPASPRPDTRSRDDSPWQTIDPHNRLLWRQNLQRLDAESLRDSLLSVSGLLRPDDGGQPRWPAVPDELTHAQPGILEGIKGEDDGRKQGWFTDPLEQTDVRSVFLVRKRSLAVPLLQAFDQPDAAVSCARRDATVVAPQALTLLNSPEAIRFARSLADRVKAEAGDAASRRIDVAFWRALGRAPSSDETALSHDLLRRHAEIHGNADSALVDLCRAIINLNEFVYVD